MKVVETKLDGVLIIEPRVFEDNRGFFLETFHSKRYADAGVPAQKFVQDNHSCSVRGTLRGLHYQLRYPQDKLVRALRGEIFDVAVDIRQGSPTFGRWIGVELTAENKRQLFIPAGFAHGFCVLGEIAEIEYKCTEYYVHDDQCGVAWNDPSIGIAWPIENPVLSERDAQLGFIDSLPYGLPEAR
jgi:dTDP-4-dehydrorhamnose 3,5-epimerase